MLRDDKNYLCLRLDLKEVFPGLRFVRRFNPDGALYFGPYASGGMARETLKSASENPSLTAGSGMEEDDGTEGNKGNEVRERRSWSVRF
jgi:excinuclease UvrABC nuclease subunit